VKTMALTNRERIGKALELLREGLMPYVQREMEAHYGAEWIERAKEAIRGDIKFKEGEPHFDAHAFLVIMWDQWNVVFRKTLGHAERSLVSEIRTWRNKWAHQETFSSDDTYRALDSISRLLSAISAHEFREVEKIKMDLLRVRFEEQARAQRRKVNFVTKGEPVSGLKPWREIVIPHPDVASGRYQQAEFAADLAAVYYEDTSAVSEYRDPVEFFKRTYLTEGLRELLRTALLRLSGKGGHPVVDLQTNFGGGKTHSMLALYHLFSGMPPDELLGIDEILGNVNISKIPKVKRVVLVGIALSPGQVHFASDGTEIHTLWGELAWQLGGRNAYSLLEKADQRGVSPGANVLRELFQKYGPVLILIDEWVAFVRQTYNRHDLPAGSFDANLSFAQALTEAVKQSPAAMLVASLPASDIEIGGEAGKEALTRLKNTFGRIEATWRPASAEESFEIVRRRLFQPISDPKLYAQRDAVISHFVRYYREYLAEFPSKCGEREYERQMRLAYPIHPELFKRLYEDWASLEKFQRTRGVLRLMAAVIHSLWMKEDSNLLIMPGTLPLDDPNVQREFTRYLEEPWTPIIEHDIDGVDSIPFKLDKENPTLGRYSACRRVARTIFLGSAPIYRAANPGLEERRIKLGCVQPGESVATFGDALRRLTNEATHLYVDRNSYWFSTQPSVTRLAQDRATQFKIETVWDELKSRLRAERKRGQFAGVHAAPEDSADIPDEMLARLVILGPEYPHVGREETSPALEQSKHILFWRGTNPRLYQNTLVFLAADQKRLSDLEQAIRQYLAWKSIYDEQDQLNLDTFQRNQAKTKMEQTNEAVKARIKETYCWLLVPEQSNPQDPESLEWEEIRFRCNESLAECASKRLIDREYLIVEYGATRLKLDMDCYHLWGAADHISIKQLLEYFARYLYLPRLKEAKVLIKAIEEGISRIDWTQLFAYAERWEDVQKHYIGLQAGKAIRIYYDKEVGFLVKPEIAKKQIQEKEKIQIDSKFQDGEEAIIGENTDKKITPTSITSSKEIKPKRFYGEVSLNPLKAQLEVKEICEHIIQHLASLGEIKVTLTIKAYIPSGASEYIVRTIIENAHTLKFDISEFEEK